MTVHLQHAAQLVYFTFAASSLSIVEQIFEMMSPFSFVYRTVLLFTAHCSFFCFYYQWITFQVGANQL